MFGLESTISYIYVGYNELSERTEKKRWDGLSVVFIFHLKKNLFFRHLFQHFKDQGFDFNSVPWLDA